MSFLLLLTKKISWRKNMSEKKVKIISIVEDIKKLKEEMRRKNAELKAMIQEAGISIFSDMSLDELESVYGYVRYCGDGEFYNAINSLMEEKKMEKYPELRQAVRFPELNQLHISNEEKRMLDNFLISCSGRYMTNAVRKAYKITEKHIEYLKQLHLIEEYLNIICPECGTSIIRISTEDINCYKEVWNLQELAEKNTLSEKQKGRLNELYIEGYSDGIACGCYECDDYIFEANSEKDLAKLTPFIEKQYRVIAKKK